MKTLFLPNRNRFYLNRSYVKINSFICSINRLYYINHDINTMSLNEYFKHDTREKLNEVRKPSLTITSAYSKSSNSSAFNSFLKKFCEMICEITVSKMVCGIFLIFCRSKFINNFIVKNSLNLNISRPISLKKNFISAKIKWKNFFFLIFFQGLGTFLTTAKPLIWASFFSAKNKFYIFFFKSDYLILI